MIEAMCRPTPEAASPAGDAAHATPLVHMPEKHIAAMHRGRLFNR
jgi:hypothetical protein